MLDDVKGSDSVLGKSYDFQLVEDENKQANEKIKYLEQMLQIMMQGQKQFVKTEECSDNKIH